MDNHFMEEAIKQAKKAYLNGDIPVGAIIVKDNEIVAKAYNRREITKNVLDHAEIIAIQKACKKIKDWRLNECTMYVTLEPCPMCSEVINQSRIKKVVYGTDSFELSKGNKIKKHKIDDINVGSKCMIIIKKFFEERRK